MEILKERNFGKYILLSIVTFGLYSVYFYQTLGHDINTLCKGDGKESFSYLAAKFLSIPTFGVFKHYWMYQQGQRLHMNAPDYGFKMVETGVDTVVLNLIPGCQFLSTYVFIKNYNRMAQVYNRLNKA